MPPLVSIIIPCYNEQATIRQLLDAVLAQTYPRSQMEIVIADAFSQDQTRERINLFQREHPDVSLCVVDNARRAIPAALNLAINSSHGEIILRLDAHSRPNPEYVERCVQALEDGKGVNVGGVWEIRPGAAGWIAESIAVAASHPLGVGDAMYRLNPKAGAVDTVPFGALRRELIDRIGGFDETLLSNEDYEFNTRVRQSGGVVWLDPQIRSTYFARASFGELARQYWRYGFWKWRMLQRYANTIRWRQALPPVFVASLIALVLLSFRFSLARELLCFEVILYLFILIAASVQVAFRNHQPFLMVGLPLSILIMHLSWGGGFLYSLLASPLFRKNG
ncbi:MAG TPA: glycosyltransferase family 2 protein [Anaerolineales bacterium]|nr:glycosyltransferase family 2 protein [Anaerolineales bacterium]